MFYTYLLANIILGVSCMTINFHFVKVQMTAALNKRLDQLRLTASEEELKAFEESECEKISHTFGERVGKVDKIKFLAWKIVLRLAFCINVSFLFRFLTL